LTQGNPVEVDRVRESLDTGSEFDPTCSVYSLADALWAFLNDLAEPVIPPSLFPTMEIDAQSIQPWSRRFLELLPPINYNVSILCCPLLEWKSNSKTGTGVEIQELHLIWRY